MTKGRPSIGPRPPATLGSDAPQREFLFSLGAIACALWLVAATACSGDETASTTTAGATTGAASGGSAGASASSSSASASSGHTSSSAGGAAGAGGGGAGAGGAPCMDTGPGEPNDTETTAYALGPIDDDNASGGVVYGVLDGPDDVDWYVYAGEDTSFNTVDPTRSVVSDLPGARICVFLECLAASLDPITCPAGTTPETSPGGRQGCCGQAEFSVTGLDCNNTISEDLNVYLRVDDPTKSAVCDGYTVAYHY